MDKAVDVAAKIRELLEREGPQYAYRIMQTLGLRSYGATEYYLTWGARRGLWKLTRISGKVIAYLPDQDPTAALTIRDVIKCLRQYVKDGEPAAKIYDYLRLCLPT
ncbi:MAG: hypothetical protein QXT27_06465 [Pyrobaculum sp.]|uniref:hypothetical protein n=1 Tax=Pyrobaculum sp. TaxID=2004705 RepID=UPI003168C6DA